MSEETQTQTQTAQRRVEREITIYATRGNTMKKITSDAQTWGELKPKVRGNGFDLNSLLAAENITKHDLINDMAVLPEGPFRLFLRPAKTKSGAPDRKECFAIIKAHIEKNPASKPNFVIDGKNMTQLSTPVLQDLVAKHCGGSSATPAAPTTEAPKATPKGAAKNASTDNGVGNAVDSVAKAKKSEEILDSQKIAQAQELISSLKGSYDCVEKVNKHLGKLADEVSNVEAMSGVPQEESPEAAARRAAKEEEESARKEAEEMMRGY